MPSEQVISVGDSSKDISATNKANICSIAATWGTLEIEELQNSEPDYIRHNPQQLKNLIRKFINRSIMLNGNFYDINFDKIYYLYDYYPTRFEKDDKYSQTILQLKENSLNAIEFWYQETKNLFEGNFAVTIVPSHSSSNDNRDSGIAEVAKKLSKSKIDEVTDLIDVLTRFKTINKLSKGGNREITNHLNSINVNQELSESKPILLLDDVATSGNSLTACKQLLQEAGAKYVFCFALTRTVGGNSDQFVQIDNSKKVINFDKINLPKETNIKTAERYFKEGNARYHQGDLDSAIANYTEAIRLNPDSSAVYGLRGLARYEKGDLDSAIADFNKAIRLNPDLAVAYYSRGLARYHQGDLDSTIVNFNAAIRLNPNAVAYFNRGLARYEKGDLDSAIADFNKAIRLNPDALAYYSRGVAHHEKGDLEGAIADYTEAIRLNPDDAEAYNNRGFARYHQGDLEGAIADYTEAIRLNPDHTIAYENRGSVYREEGKIIRSINDFRNGSNSIYSCVGKAIESAEITQSELDSIAESFYNRITKIKEQNLNDLFENNDKSIKSNRYDAKNFFNRGLGYFAKKEFEKAIDDFNQYLHLQSSNSDTTNIYRKQGIIKLCRGKFGQAINKFDEYLTRESDNINSDDYFLRGLAQFHSLTFQFGLYGDLGDIQDPWEKVINDFNQALSLNSKDSESYHYLGCIYIFLGKVETSSHIEKGIYYLKQSIKLNPENIKSYNLLANHFFEEEDYQKAIDYCTQGLAIDSSNPNLYQLRGEIYRKQEKFKQAINDFQKAANLFLEEYRNNIGYRNEWGNYQDTIDSIHKIIFPSDP